jgi:hypothetical protein
MKSILLTTLFILSTSLFYSQKTVTVTGGNIAGNGSVSYTIGQLITATNKAKTGSVAQGVQQSLELFTLVNPELLVLTLKAVTYPNPTKDKIMLSLTDNSLNNLSYAMYDLGGRMVTKGKVNKENTSIHMRYLVTGVYILKVHQNKKQLKVFKIIKN